MENSYCVATSFVRKTVLLLLVLYAKLVALQKTSNNTVKIDLMTSGKTNDLDALK